MACWYARHSTLLCLHAELRLSKEVHSDRYRAAHTFGSLAAAPPSDVNARISSTLASASMNRMSAPASAKAAARHRASSRDSAWRASERARIKMSDPSSLQQLRCGDVYVHRWLGGVVLWWMCGFVVGRLAGTSVSRSCM